MSSNVVDFVKPLMTRDRSAWSVSNRSSFTGACSALNCFTYCFCLSEVGVRDTDAFVFEGLVSTQRALNILVDSFRESLRCVGIHVSSTPGKSSASSTDSLSSSGGVGMPDAALTRVLMESRGVPAVTRACFRAAYSLAACCCSELAMPLLKLDWQAHQALILVDWNTNGGTSTFWVLGSISRQSSCGLSDEYHALCPVIRLACVLCIRVWASGAYLLSNMRKYSLETTISSAIVKDEVMLVRKG